MRDFIPTIQDKLTISSTTNILLSTSITIDTNDEPMSNIDQGHSHASVIQNENHQIPITITMEVSTPSSLPNSIIHNHPSNNLHGKDFTGAITTLHQFIKTSFFVLPI